MKEECAKGVDSKCDGNEDWCGLKRKLLDLKKGDTVCQPPWLAGKENFRFQMV